MFLDTEIYLHNGILHTKICRKETYRQQYLHIKSEHPKSLKDSLPYSQAITVKQISSNQADLNNSFKEMKNNFTKQGYHPSLINEHLESISLLERIYLIREKDTRKKSGRILLVITYNQFLPNITKSIRKNWNILQINKNIKEIFKHEPITAFKQNKNIQEIIGLHWIENGRVKKNLKTWKEGK